MPVMRHLCGSKIDYSQTLPQNLVSILLMQHFCALCLYVHNKTRNVYLETGYILISRWHRHSQLP